MTWGNVLMVCVALVFLYLAIGKGFEPLLLLPIAFGMLLVNIYPDIMAKVGEVQAVGNGSKGHVSFGTPSWSIPQPNSIWNSTAKYVNGVGNTVFNGWHAGASFGGGNNTASAIQS